MNLFGTPFIHYGSPQYIPEKFMSIKNAEFVKPTGGLWASPIGSTCGWKSWCEAENFRLDTFDDYFTFYLKDSSHILTLEYEKDLIGIPQQNRSFWFDEAIVTLDFEKLLALYDALYYPNPSGELQWKLYGWDCDSLLVMNPECMIFDKREQNNV